MIDGGRRDAAKLERRRLRAGPMFARGASQGDWLKVEYLPAYAPELNPAEGVWASLKGTELANLCARTTDEVIATAQVGLFRSAASRSCCLGSCATPA
jgi:transposase